jgi:hypothetical protein
MPSDRGQRARAPGALTTFAERKFGKGSISLSARSTYKVVGLRLRTTRAQRRFISVGLYGGSPTEVSGLPVSTTALGVQNRVQRIIDHSRSEESRR